MTVDEPRPRTPAIGRRKLLVWLTASAALLAASWVFAHHPAVAPAASLDEIESVSAGRALLAAGAVPWLLQWAACAVLLAAVGRGVAGVDWTALLYGALLHLVVGLSWWIGLAAMWWRASPVEAALEAASWWAARAFGSETPGQFLLFEGIGPLACPLRLAGPVSMQGWAFAWAGLSTVLVVGYWTWAVHKLRANEQLARQRPRRQFLFSFVLTAVYVSPMLIRAALRVAAAAGYAIPSFDQVIP